MTAVEWSIDEEEDDDKWNELKYSLRVIVQIEGSSNEGSCVIACVNEESVFGRSARTVEKIEFNCLCKRHDGSAFHNVESWWCYE